MKRKPILFDTKCYDLAETFLDEAVECEDEAQMRRMKDELAGLIQAVIEDAIANWENPERRPK